MTLCTSKKKWKKDRYIYVKLKVDLFIFLFTKAAMMFLSIITSASSMKLCECLCMYMYVFPLKNPQKNDNLFQTYQKKNPIVWWNEMKTVGKQEEYSKRVRKWKQITQFICVGLVFVITDFGKILPRTYLKTKR